MKKTIVILAVQLLCTLTYAKPLDIQGNSARGLYNILSELKTPEDKGEGMMTVKTVILCTQHLSGSRNPEISYYCMGAENEISGDTAEQVYVSLPPAGSNARFKDDGVTFRSGVVTCIKMQLGGQNVFFSCKN